MTAANAFPQATDNPAEQMMRLRTTRLIVGTGRFFLLLGVCTASLVPSSSAQDTQSDTGAAAITLAKLAVAPIKIGTGISALTTETIDTELTSAAQETPCYFQLLPAISFTESLGKVVDVTTFDFGDEKPDYVLLNGTILKVDATTYTLTGNLKSTRNRNESSIRIAVRSPESRDLATDLMGSLWRTLDRPIEVLKVPHPDLSGYWEDLENHAVIRVSWSPQRPTVKAIRATMDGKPAFRISGKFTAAGSGAAPGWDDYEGTWTDGKVSGKFKSSNTQATAVLLDGFDGRSLFFSAGGRDLRKWKLIEPDLGGGKWQVPDGLTEKGRIPVTFSLARARIDGDPGDGMPASKTGWGLVKGLLSGDTIYLNFLKFDQNENRYFVVERSVGKLNCEPGIDPKLTIGGQSWIFSKDPPTSMPILKSSTFILKGKGDSRWLSGGTIYLNYWYATTDGSGQPHTFGGDDSALRSGDTVKLITRNPDSKHPNYNKLSVPKTLVWKDCFYSFDNGDFENWRIWKGGKDQNAGTDLAFGDEIVIETCAYPNKFLRPGSDKWLEAASPYTWIISEAETTDLPPTR